VSSYTLEFFAWCRDGSADKVWGYFNLGDERTRYSFWGRRGNKLSFKEHRGSEARKLRGAGNRKTDKGYKAVTIDQIEAVTPGFVHEFEQQFVIAKLFERFHGKTPGD
jgi:hypothetical protein